MRLTNTLISAALIAALGTSAAFAQTAPAAPTATKPAVTAPAAPATTAPAATAPAKMKATGKERTEKSLACSKDADTKNIHGKERKKFMSACKKA